MRERVLAVDHRRTRILEQLPSLPPELDRDDRVERPVADRDRRDLGQVELEPVDGRDEAGERDQCGRARPSLSEAEGVGHHGALREAAEHGSIVPDSALFQEAVQPGADVPVGRLERLAIGIPHLPERVPVRPARRERERAARRHAEEPLLRIEEVEQRIEIELVGAAPMEEHKGAGRLALGLPYLVVQAARGSGSGVSTSSSRSRSAS